MFKFVIFGCLPILDSVAASGSEAVPAADVRIEEVIVTGVRRTAQLEAIDRSGAARPVEFGAGTETATALLRDAPGTFFQQTTPGQSTPIVRGLRGSQVLHLVDGIRLNHALFRDAPNQYLALVPMGGLEAVEVLPGAAPALYGADAIGGVVALRSRMPALGGEARVRDGRLSGAWSSADLSQTWVASGSLATARAALEVGVADSTYGNRRIGGGDRLSATGYDAHGAFLSGQWAPAPEHRIEIGGQWLEQPSTPRYDELVPGFGQVEPSSERFLFAPNSRLMGRVGWRWRSAARPERRLKVDLARQRIVDDRISRDTGAATTTLENNRSTLHGLVAQWQDRIGERGRWMAGAELYLDRVDSARAEQADDGTIALRPPRFTDGSRMRTASLFAVPEWAPSDDLTLTVGLRANAWRVEVPGLDEVAGVDLEAREMTGRLGVRWRVAPRWTLYGSYGRGFRPPNVFDLGALGPRPGNRFNIGNPGLGPETADQIEFGLRFRSTMLHVELTSFATTIDARIRSVGTGAVTPTGRDVVQTVNGGESRYRGVEAQLRWAPADALRVDTVVSYVRAEDAFAGEVTAGDRVPPLHGRIRFSRSLPAGLDVHLTLAGASRQDRLSARDIRDPRIDPSGTDGWVRADLGALWQVSNGLRVRVDAGNLLDARYREHGSGLDAAGRHLAVAFDWNF